MITKIKTWTQIKEDVYGKPGTPRRDNLKKDFDSFANKLGFKK